MATIYKFAVYFPPVIDMQIICKLLRPHQVQECFSPECVAVYFLPVNMQICFKAKYIFSFVISSIRMHRNFLKACYWLSTAKRGR